MGEHTDSDGDGLADQPAATANEQDHDDPWQYASDEPADPPTDTGRPATEES